MMLKTNKTWNAMCMMCMISLVYIMIVSSVDDKRMTMKPNEEKFQQVSLYDIKSNIDEKETFTLYVAREECNYCKKLKPLIYRRSYRYKDILYFYSTSADRIYNKNYMDVILKKIHVETVPCIIYIRNGLVVSKIEYRDIIKYHEKKR